MQPQTLQTSPFRPLSSLPMIAISAICSANARHHRAVADTGFKRAKRFRVKRVDVLLGIALREEVQPGNSTTLLIAIPSAWLRLSEPPDAERQRKGRR
jgi:hypothetical protein